MEVKKNDKKNPVSKRPRPILMIPLRRCGSHALRLRLNFSRDFYSPYPLHIVDFMPLVDLYGDLTNDETYFQMVIDVVGLQTVSMVKWPDVVFDPVEIFERIKDEPRSIHRIIWEILFIAASKEQATIVMDKSLDSVHYADELMDLFDDMLFLNVVRDPRAQISSMNLAIIHDFDTLLNAMTWVKAHKAADALIKKHPDRVLTIRFEDFVNDQEAVLRKTCSFFGIEYLPEMLDVSHSAEAHKISGLSALWESNHFPPIPAAVNKFRKNLTTEEINIIETLTCDYMDRYGYETMTPANSTITPQIVENARKRSEANKQKAWATLRQNNNRDYQLRKFRADYLKMVESRLQKNRIKPVCSDTEKRYAAAS